MAVLVDGAQYLFGLAAYGTAKKVINSVDARIRASPVVKGICKQRSWQHPQISLTLEINFDRTRLNTLIAQCLQSLINYQSYRGLSQEAKNRFKEDLAQRLANKMQIDERKIVGTETTGYFSSRRVVQATIPLLPLLDSEVANVITAAGDKAGISFAHS